MDSNDIKLDFEGCCFEPIWNRLFSLNLISMSIFEQSPFYEIEN